MQQQESKRHATRTEGKQKVGRRCRTCVVDAGSLNRDRGLDKGVSLHVRHLTAWGPTWCYHYDIVCVRVFILQHVLVLLTWIAQKYSQ